MKLVIRRIIENWLKEHSRVRNIFEKSARMKRCATIEGLINDSRLSQSEIERHCMVFALHSYFVAPLPNTYCSKSAIEKIWEQF